jgi:hypothetical protein
MSGEANGGNGRNGNVYKFIAGMMGTALLTFVSTWMLMARDTVKREDFEKLQSEVVTLEIQLAKISERLGIRDK